MNAHTIRNRLAALYQKASKEDLQAGHAWYAAARMEAVRLARKHGVTEATAAGVIAAISPQMRWSENIRVADAVLGGANHGTFRANILKAIAIREGARPLGVLSGPKVRAFYQAIRGNESAAVIDVWMVRAARWTRKLTPKAYALIAKAIASVAVVFGTTVARVQAVVWTVIRGSAT